MVKTNKFKKQLRAALNLHHRNNMTGPSTPTILKMDSPQRRRRGWLGMELHGLLEYPSREGLHAARESPK